MDFLYLDQDKQDLLLKEFLRPQPLLSQPLFETSESYIKLVDRCGPDPDVCVANGQKIGSDPDGFDPNGGLNTGGPNNPETPPDTPENENEPHVLTCEMEQYVEQESDRLAQEIADEIRNQGDWNLIEYGAVIYRGPNGYRRDPLDTGTTDNIDWTINTLLGESVVALVHSHPRLSYSIPSPGDRTSADQAINSTNGNSLDFSHYILNFDDDTLFEYDNDDRPRSDGLGDGTEKDSSDAEGNCDV